MSPEDDLELEALTRELSGEINRVRELTADTLTVSPTEAHSVPDLARLRSDVDALVREESGLLGRWRARRTVARMTALVAVSLLVTAAFAFARPRPDLGALSPTQVALTVGSAFLLLPLVVGEMMRPYHRPAAPPALLVGLLAATALVPVVAALVPHHHAAGQVVDGTAFDAASMHCLLTGALVGLPVLLFGIASVHRWQRRRLPGLLGAAAAGLVGNTALVLHCPIAGAGHQLSGHATLIPLLVAVLAASLSIRRLSE